MILPLSSFLFLSLSKSVCKKIGISALCVNTVFFSVTFAGSLPYVEVLPAIGINNEFADEFLKMQPSILTSAPSISMTVFAFSKMQYLNEMLFIISLFFVSSS